MKCPDCGEPLISNTIVQDQTICLCQNGCYVFVQHRNGNTSEQFLLKQDSNCIVENITEIQIGKHRIQKQKKYCIIRHHGWQYLKFDTHIPFGTIDIHKFLTKNSVHF